MKSSEQAQTKQKSLSKEKTINPNQEVQKREKEAARDFAQYQEIYDQNIQKSQRRLFVYIADSKGRPISPSFAIADSRLS